MAEVKDASGTYTETVPAYMNRTELYFWRRKQAGLTKDPTPASQASDTKALEAEFGEDWKNSPVPAPTRQEAIAKMFNRFKPATTGHVVQADEYVKHHASSFGTSESKSLAAGLNNLYSDSYEVIEVKPNVVAVVNPKKGEVDIIHDEPLTQNERQNIIKTIDMAGDVPNKVVFMPQVGTVVNHGKGIETPNIEWIGGTQGEQGAIGATGRPGAAGAASGGGSKAMSGVMIAVIGVLAILWYLMSGRR